MAALVITALKTGSESCKTCQIHLIKAINKTRVDIFRASFLKTRKPAVCPKLHILSIVERESAPSELIKLHLLCIVFDLPGLALVFCTMYFRCTFEDLATFRPLYCQILHFTNPKHIPCVLMLN